MGIFRELSTSEILQVVGGNAAVSVGIPGVSNMGGEGEASGNTNNPLAQNQYKTPDVINNVATYCNPDGNGTYQMQTVNAVTGDFYNYNNVTSCGPSSNSQGQASNNQGQSPQHDYSTPIDFQIPSASDIAGSIKKPDFNWNDLE
jgi:hypothetical protein